jgi:hypothetical protein
MISSGSEGFETLETIFHEASHGFMLGNDSLQIALQEAAEQLGTEVPRGLWHVILFETTGETVRQALVAGGEPDYVPMIVAIYRRSSWARYRDAIDAVWPSYLDGTLGAQEAMVKLINEINKAGHVPGR